MPVGTVQPGVGRWKPRQSDSALIEWMKEIRGIRGDRPITDDELAAGKAALTQGLLEEFASTRAVSDAIRAIYLEGLPENYYQQFAGNVVGPQSKRNNRSAASIR